MGQVLFWGVGEWGRRPLRRMGEVGRVTMVESLKWSGGGGVPWRRCKDSGEEGRGRVRRSSALVRYRRRLLIPKCVLHPDVAFFLLTSVHASYC